MPAILPETLDRWGWRVFTVAEDGDDSIRIECPRCKLPAFDKNGHLDDPAHVYSHYVGADKADQRGREALKHMGALARLMTCGDLRPDEVVQVLRFLGAALRELAPDASMHLESAGVEDVESRWK